MKLLLFFVDGLGLGRDDESNPARDLLEGIAALPFCAASAPAEFDSGILRSVDPCGWIPGIPQSATGQSSLLTGTNAPALLGYHLNALPNQILVDLIHEKGLMKNLVNAGVRATSSNLYTQGFFDHRESLAQKRGRNMLPVSTLTIRGSGVPFRFLKDYHEGRAVFSDLCNHFLQLRGYDIPLISPEEAARRVARIFESSDFIFHEYFATDTYAHKKRHTHLHRALDEINRFLRALISLTNPQETSILLTSDHGNCESIDSADHNRNPVPLLLLSENQNSRQRFSEVHHLHEVKKAIGEFFEVDL